MINTDYNREVNNLNKEGIYTNEELFGLIQKWMKLRTDDMNFVIDTILNKAESDHIPFINISMMGGAASVWLGRQRDDIRAVVNIDAPFFSELVYQKETMLL